MTAKLFTFERRHRLNSAFKRSQVGKKALSSVLKAILNVFRLTVQGHKTFVMTTISLPVPFASPSKATLTSPEEVHRGSSATVPPNIQAVLNPLNEAFRIQNVHYEKEKAAANYLPNEPYEVEGI